MQAVRIKEFRCVKEAEIRLTPLHALIGPNDSGKSSLLRAISDDVQGIVFYPREDGVQLSTKQRRSELGGYRRGDVFLRPNPTRPLLRLDPDELRKDVPLYTTSTKLWFQSERGLGLAGLYDTLLGRDRRAFTQLEDRFRALFPTVAAIRLYNASAQTKSIGLTLVGGEEVSAAQMSEGMLYWLAFAIVEHLAPVEMLLIEEPENGLHPSRIREVVTILREISKRTHVLLATHSPLVINELGPDEVTIVTRDAERGTICTPMRETKMFEQRSKVYALGELWLSYADGNFETELVPETPAQE